MEKVAIIEIDETNLKLLILDVEQGGYYNVFDRVTENIKLGKYVASEGIVPANKITETLTILKLFRKVCDSNKVNKVYSICTSFIRDAKNQKSFFDEIYNNTSFSFNVLSMDDEIKAVYSGVINYVDVPKGVIIDVEPNYTHIIHYNRRTLINVSTLNFGAVSLADKQMSYSDIIEMVKAELGKYDYLKTLDPETMFVGTGSTMISIGRLAKKVSHYPLDVDNNYVVSNTLFEAVFDKVKNLDLDKTQKLKGISQDRADTLVPGMSIVKAILDYLSVTSFSVSAGGIEEGLVYNYIVPETNEKPLSDMLTYSLETIRIFYDRPMSNTENVYNLAIILFKQLKVMHKLPRSYVKALRIAASMYDCGTRVNFENYSNYSFEIIVNSKLNGVSHKDLLLAGFACKFQNLDNVVLSEWIKYKDILTDEDLDAVRKLGVIIKLAASLDRSRSKKVVDICCDILGDSVIMKTIVSDNATFDIMQGMKVGADFKKILKKYLQII